MSRILVLEDDALIAIDVEMLLESAGHAVVGPVSCQAAALVVIDEQALDAALIDINLGSEKAFDVADRLAKEGVPFAFLSGHSRASVPSDHADRPFIAKPYTHRQVIEQVSKLLKDATS